MREADPTMSFRMLASQTNITVKHVWECAGHLLYWGKATIIYPICENNVYVISPKNKTNFTADMLCLVYELILYCFVV